MGALVIEMVRVSLDDFARGDSADAAALARQDRMVDGYYGCLLKNLIAVMARDAREIGAATHLLFVAKTLERIGDNAAKIGRSLDLVGSGHAAAEPRAA
jgi:phosphate transport system protein